VLSYHHTHIGVYQTYVCQTLVLLFSILKSKFPISQKKEGPKTFFPASLLMFLSVRPVLSVRDLASAWSDRADLLRHGSAQPLIFNIIRTSFTPLPDSPLYAIFVGDTEMALPLLITGRKNSVKQFILQQAVLNSRRYFGSHL